jgi:VWFA-related protein
MKSSPSFTAILFTLVICLLASTFLNGQKETLPPLQYSMEVRLLQVEVAVLDKDGNFVPGLQKEDFSLWEDNKQQKIQYVDEVHTAIAVPENTDTAATQTITAAAPQKAVQSIALIFDGCSSSQMSMRSVKEPAKDFITKNSNKNNLMAIFAIDAQGNYHLEQAFTNSASDLIKTIDRLNVGTGGAESRASKIKALDTIIESLQKCLIISDLEGKRQCTEGTLKMGLSQATNYATEEQRSARNTTESLQDIFTFLRHTPGKKSVLFFSDGFDTTGNFYFHYLQESMLQWVNTLNITYDPTNMIAEAQRAISKEASRASYIQKLIDKANSSELTVYWLNPQNPDQLFGADSSLKASIATSSIPNLLLEQLKSVGEDTGGFTIRTGTDFNQYFNKLAKNLTSYYLVSYVPDRQAHDGKQHTIKVTTSKPDMKIQTRKTVTDYSIEDQVSMMLASALDFTDVNTQIPIEADFAYIVDEKNKLNVITSIAIPFDSITPLYEGAAVADQVHFAYLIKNKDGVIVVKEHKILNINMADPEYKNLAQDSSHFQNLYSFQIEPGTYTLYAAIVEVGGWKITSWKTPLTISFKNDKCFGLSPLIVASKLQTANISPEQAQKHLLSLEKDGSITYKDKKMTYSAVKKLPSSGQLAGLYQIYQASTASNGQPNIAISFQLYDDANTLISSLPPTQISQFTDPGKKLITNFFMLPYKYLAPKKYKLVFKANDQENNCTAESSTYFTIIM